MLPISLSLYWKDVGFMWLLITLQFVSKTLNCKLTLPRLLVLYLNNPYDMSTEGPCVAFVTCFETSIVEKRADKQVYYTVLARRTYSVWPSGLACWSIFGRFYSQACEAPSSTFVYKNVLAPLKAIYCKLTQMRSNGNSCSIWLLLKRW